MAGAATWWAVGRIWGAIRCGCAIGSGSSCCGASSTFPAAARAWTGRYRDWLSGLRFEDRAWEVCFADYPHAPDVPLARRDGLDRALAELAGDCPWSATVGPPRCLRRVDTLTAGGLRAAVWDFARFPGPQALAAYAGPVPPPVKFGPPPPRRDTKAGSGHARRLPVEAAHHHTRPPRISRTLHSPQPGRPPAVIETARRRQAGSSTAGSDRVSSAANAGRIVTIATAREPAGLRPGARRRRTNPAQTITGRWAGASEATRPQRPPEPGSAATSPWPCPTLHRGPCHEQTA